LLIFLAVVGIIVATVECVTPLTYSIEDRCDSTIGWNSESKTELFDGACYRGIFQTDPNIIAVKFRAAYDCRVIIRFTAWIICPFYYEIFAFTNITGREVDVLKMTPTESCPATSNIGTWPNTTQTSCTACYQQYSHSFNITQDTEFLTGIVPYWYYHPSFTYEYFGLSNFSIVVQLPPTASPTVSPTISIISTSSSSFSSSFSFSSSSSSSTKSELNENKNVGNNNSGTTNSTMQLLIALVVIFAILILCISCCLFGIHTFVVRRLNAQFTTLLNTIQNGSSDLNHSEHIPKSNMSINEEQQKPLIVISTQTNGGSENAPSGENDHIKEGEVNEGIEGTGNVKDMNS